MFLTAGEESGKQLMDDGSQKLELSKEEKIEALIKRLGYRNMSMPIFNKMRETFGTEECEFCGRLFYSKVDYEPHIRTHTGKLVFLNILAAFVLLGNLSGNFLGKLVSEKKHK